MKLSPVLQLEGHRLPQPLRFPGDRGELCDSTSSRWDPRGRSGLAGWFLREREGGRPCRAVPGRGPPMAAGAAAGAFGPTSSGLSACRCLVGRGLNPSASASTYMCFPSMYTCWVVGTGLDKTPVPGGAHRSRTEEQNRRRQERGGRLPSSRSPGVAAGRGCPRGVPLCRPSRGRPQLLHPCVRASCGANVPRAAGPAALTTSLSPPPSPPQRLNSLRLRVLHPAPERPPAYPQLGAQAAGCPPQPADQVHRGGCARPPCHRRAHPQRRQPARGSLRAGGFAGAAAREPHGDEEDDDGESRHGEVLQPGGDQPPDSRQAQPLGFLPVPQPQLHRPRHPLPHL